MAANQSWSLIIFGYNECHNIEYVYTQAKAELTKMSPSHFEIIIVDDGSTDGSTEVAKRLAKDNPNTLAVLHPTNSGIGRALLSGYSAARFENVCAVPADGQFDLQELKPFVNVKAGSFISFYREKQIGYSFYRTFLSAGNRWLNRFVGGIALRDVNWVKIYKTDQLKKLNLRVKSSLVESEICGKLFRRGCCAIETPSIYKSRRSGHSKAARFTLLIHVLAETLVLYFVLLMDWWQEPVNGRNEGS